MPLSTRASWNQSAITEKPVSSWQTAYHSPGTGVVADFPGGHEEPDRTTDRVGDGMELRVHPALRPPSLSGHSLRKYPAGQRSGGHAPLFRPQAGGRAVRLQVGGIHCPAGHHAVMSREGMEIVLLSGASAASPVMIRANTPKSLHLSQRL